MMNKGQAIPRELAHLIGLYNSTCSAVPLACLITEHHKHSKTGQLRLSCIFGWGGIGRSPIFEPHSLSLED